LVYKLVTPAELRAQEWLGACTVQPVRWNA
jgi:hypothetical protein